MNGKLADTEFIHEGLLVARDLAIGPEDQVAVAQVCENLTVLGETPLRRD